MKQNIDKLLDRDVALNNLASRADDLQSSATSYNQTARQLRKKYWWKNAKVCLKNNQYFLTSKSKFLLDKCMHRWNYYHSNHHYYM